MSVRKVFSLLGLTLFFASSFSVANAQPVSQHAGESTVVSNLLLQAKKDAMQLRNDAEDLYSFNRSKVSWESHGMKLNQIRDEVNSLGVLVAELNDERAKASPWQQQAIDRITPMLKELAAKVQVVIKDLKNNPQSVQTYVYRDDYATIAEISSNLAARISDVVEYDQTNAKLEELAHRLEIS